MRHSRTLSTRIMLRFAVIILPIALIVVAQTLVDARRNAELAAASDLMTAADRTVAQYKQCLDGAADAVDTGRLGSGAL